MSNFHQGAIVFKIPPYKNTSIEEPVRVSVEVRVGAEKDKRCSDSISFSYTPETTDDARKTSSCSKCNSIKDALSHLFANDSKKVNVLYLSKAEVTLYRIVRCRVIAE